MPQTGKAFGSLPSGIRVRWLSRQAAATYLGVALLGGCDRIQPLVTDTPAVALRVAEFVAGDAARNLGSEGRFTLAAAASPTGVPIITAERAGELALANVRTFAPSFLGGWEQDRGASIDVRSLRIDSRIFYAETPYDIFPEGYHPAYRRSFGPYYLVRLVSGSTPVLLVAVSAYSTDVRVEKNGKLSLPAVGGDEFFELAISSVPNAGFQPIQPEEAVERVGRLTGGRTEEVPELILRGVREHPATALWKVSLDRAVPLKEAKGDRRVSARTLYVGPGGTLFVPAASTPRSDRGVFRSDPSGRTSAKAVAEVRVRSGRIAAFDEVVIDPAGR
ncbi:MAG TPA: hypothetical protein VF584_15630 [Longimicrobium sp.]|jgi:hypothetical protein